MDVTRIWQKWAPYSDDRFTSYLLIRTPGNVSGVRLCALRGRTPFAVSQARLLAGDIYHVLPMPRACTDSHGAQQGHVQAAARLHYSCDISSK